MTHTPRGAIWLGDALRAAAALAPGPEALALLLRCLGLVDSAAALALGRGPAYADRPSADEAAESRARAAAKAVTPSPEEQHPEPEPAPDAARNHRLPSRIEALDKHTPSPPAWWNDTAPLTLAQASPPAARPPRAARPLIAPLKRRALLTAALATQVADGAPDVAKVVDELAAGRPLRRLPRQPRRTLARGVEVLVDQAPWMLPFRADQHELGAYLRCLLPPERVQWRVFEGLPPTPAEAAAAQPRAAEGAPALLLSDLGIGTRLHAQRAATPAEWRVWTAQQRRRGRAPRALLPYPPARWPAVPGLPMLPWGERLEPVLVRRAIAVDAGAAAPRLRVDRAADTQDEKQREVLLALARRLSPVLRVSPWLLRETRLALNLGAGIEADLAASPLVRTAGPTGLVLQPEALVDLRLALAADPVARDTALALVHAEHADLSVLTQVEQALIEAELLGHLNEARVEQLLAPALKAVTAPGPAGAEIAAWAAHAWGRCSPAVRATATARQLAFAAAARVDARAWLMYSGRVPALPGQAPWLFDHLPRVALSVQLRAYADGSINLVVGPEEPATTALHHIEVPQAGDVWLEVRASDGGPTQTTRIDPGQPAQIEVSFGGPQSSLELRALDGAMWRLHPSTLHQQVRSAMLSNPSLFPRGALVVDRDIAIAPGAVSAGMSRAAILLHTGGGQDCRAMVGEQTLTVQDTAVAVLRILRPSPVLPLDAEIRQIPATTDWQYEAQFIPLNADGPAPAEPLRYSGEGSFEGPDGYARFDRIGLLNPSPWGAWSLTGDGRSSFGYEPLAKVVDAARQLLATGEWRGFIVAEPGNTDAFALWDTLVSRVGGERFVHDHDGRILGRPEVLARTLDECAAVIIVGSGNPRKWLHAEVLQALLDGKPFAVVAPRPGAAKELAHWWPELRKQASGNLIDSTGGQEEVADRVLTWSPWRVEQVPAAPLLAPAAQRSIATSLRARFAALMENGVQNATGLFRVEFTAEGYTLVPAPSLDALADAGSAPLLLFIHGEASNTEGSFGALLKAAGGERERLRATYVDRIYAWQYRSVTVGPIATTSHLIGTLPYRARLHIVSMAAGGILGELLSLERATPLNGESWTVALECELPDGSAEPNHRSRQAELSSVLREHLPHVERFVRIACPAQGTPLYGKGFDRALLMTKFLPLIGQAFALLPGSDRLLSDPQVSPGLTSLTPRGGVIPLLESFGNSDTTLRVLAAVRHGGGLFDRMKLGLLRLVSGSGDDRDDMIVPLASALGGIERRNGVDYLIDEGPDADHFAFMRKPGLRRAIVDALLASPDQIPAGFKRADSLAAARSDLALPELASENSRKLA